MKMQAFKNIKIIIIIIIIIKIYFYHTFLRVS